MPKQHKTNSKTNKQIQLQIRIPQQPLRIKIKQIKLLQFNQFFLLKKVNLKPPKINKSQSKIGQNQSKIIYKLHK